MSQKQAETQLLSHPWLWLEGKWRSPSASACRGSGRSLWFLKDPYLSPLLPTLRPSWPPRPEHRVYFLLLEKCQRVSSGQPMMSPQNTLVPSYSHTKHWLACPLGQPVPRLATGTQRKLGCSPSPQRSHHPLEDTDCGLGIENGGHPKPSGVPIKFSKKGSDLTDSSDASSTFLRWIQHSAAKAFTRGHSGPCGSPHEGVGS